MVVELKTKKRTIRKDDEIEKEISIVFNSEEDAIFNMSNE